MLTKIDNSAKFGKQSGGFGIQILYPGSILPHTKDSGISTIGRIDHAKVTPGTLIPMHPHRDDEILTYLRSGKVKHLDSEGHTGIISNRKLMMMSAGQRFYHEELVLDEGDDLEGLQIFIRPEQKGLEPLVRFHDLPEMYSLNAWRKIAGRGADYPVEIRSNTWIQDMRLEKNRKATLPPIPTDIASMLFYVFDGEVQVNDKIILHKGESMLIEQEMPVFTAFVDSDIMLFITDKNASYYEGGMYSGNQKR